MCQYQKVETIAHQLCPMLVLWFCSQEIIVITQQEHEQQNEQAKKLD